MRGSLGSNKASKTEAIIRERALAKRLGGKAQSNSGSGDDKGDVLHHTFLIDDKFTATRSYTLSKETLDKLSREARGHDREPLLMIKFKKGIAKGNPSEWAVIPKRLFNEETIDQVDVRGKTTLISVQIVNNLYKKSIREEAEPARTLKFYNITLAVDSAWVLVPLQDLERRGYFD